MTTSTTIYFVRHGKTQFSKDLEREGGGAKLTEEGERDARRVAEQLSGEGIDVIVSSPQHRARDTVAPLAERLGKEITLMEALKERAIGSLRLDIPDEEFRRAVALSFEDLDAALPEGETTRQARDRAVPVIRRLLKAHAGKRIAIGTHGNIMTILLHYFDARYGYAFWASTSKPDIYRARFEGERLAEVERLWEEEGAPRPASVPPGGDRR
ncbi:histidine phosphatase family protein [Paenibacillus methanolicus]|uniref:2,3-bisphosphoglycerate-dependent phosphoglycerate mutase n=1 Tax=Paenibacillus methanolicus TaxID=582686 RepID=A0A5S5BU38_9BACL|nr:histidine phosphatase family protein [Paenibacillus methanolicus]TYP69722.1 2,3-bisphosphoglycerate-dependent phosphoglycerate mutase [Paenibacillus methanolicus]